MSPDWIVPRAGPLIGNAHFFVHISSGGLVGAIRYIGETQSRSTDTPRTILKAHP